MKPIDIAVVGTGGIATVHATDLARLGGRVRLVAAVDVDRPRLEAFTRRFGVLRGYPSIQEMLERERPEVVALCTPPALHHDQALECLGNGRVVLCEKPPALSLAQFDTIAGADPGGRFATVFQHRFGSGGRRLARLARSGRFGAPMTALCHTLWYRPDDYFTVDWRGDWAVEGGGPTLGHGIHQIDLMLSILGPWREVVAVAARRARPTKTEDLSCAIVTFDSGAVATVVNSLLSPREESYLRFDFDHATVELRHLYGYSDGDWTVTPAPGCAEPVLAAWRERPSGQASGHLAQYLAVLRAIELDEPVPVTTAEARSTLELVAAVYASAFTARPVRRGEIVAGTPFYDRMQGGGAPWA